MRLTLSDHTLAISVGHLDLPRVLDLLAELPTNIRVRVEADEPFQPIRTVRTCTVLEPHPPGYFGLAVAQAYDTWGEPRYDPEYEAYLRSERPDPRD